MNRDDDSAIRSACLALAAQKHAAKVTVSERKVSATNRSVDDVLDMAASEVVDFFANAGMHHYGDPCIHCNTPHDDVSPGACTGDPAKAVPIAWRSMGVRYDGVEKFLIQLSNGEQDFFHAHHTAGVGYPGGYLHGVRYDQHLRLKGTSPSSPSGESR